MLKMKETPTILSWPIINEYIEKGLLMKQKHPDKDIWILNYTRSCQFEKKWDDVTLSCRGMVVDKDGKIVSRCMKKFFVYDEMAASEIPDEPYEITEKLDGQLGFLFFYDNEWIFASRGSFTSIYAQKGRQLLEKYKYKKLDTRYTYIFEIIFKEGRIVCKYDFEDLIMICCINIETGIEKLIHNAGFEGYGFKLVKKYDDITDFKVLKSTIGANAEGYVIRFRSGLRMKIKGAEYYRLHSILTRITSIIIWRHLKENIPVDKILDRVPDEFDNWVKNKIKTFYDAFDITEKLCHIKYLTDIGLTENLSRKEVVEKILKQEKSLQKIYFSIYNNKDFSQIIWRKLRPAYEKPFIENDDEGDI